MHIIQQKKQIINSKKKIERSVMVHHYWPKTWNCKQTYFREGNKQSETSRWLGKYLYTQDKQLSYRLSGYWDNLLFNCIKTWHQWNASARIGKKKENNSCLLPTNDGAPSSEMFRLYWNFTASEERILIKFLKLVYIRSLRVFNLFWPNFRNTAAGKTELQLSNLYTVGFHLQGIKLWADTKSET